jgi:hypothetical protein
VPSAKSKTTSIPFAQDFIRSAGILPAFFRPIGKNQFHWQNILCPRIGERNPQ